MNSNLAQTSGLSKSTLVRSIIESVTTTGHYPRGAKGHCICFALEPPQIELNGFAPFNPLFILLCFSRAAILRTLHKEIQDLWISAYESAFGLHFGAILPSSVLCLFSKVAVPSVFLPTDTGEIRRVVLFSTEQTDLDSSHGVGLCHSS